MPFQSHPPNNMPLVMPKMPGLSETHYPYYYNQNLSPHNPINPNAFPQGAVGSKLVI